jgi:enoyl-[acyl-carrier protein] reductase III
MSELAGKVAVVTGASKGIGRATAIRLAKAGADVAINYLTSESEARQTAQAVMDLGRQAIIVKADVSEEDDAAELIEKVVAHWGRIDILISNAASGGFRNILDANSRNFDTAMRTNVRALMICTQHAVPYMKQNGGGKIIGVSSHGSHRALTSYGLIGASKAALESLIRHLALELGPFGINCNCVLAGLVQTNSTRALSDEMFADAQSKLLAGKGKRLEPEHVAEAIAFLCMPASEMIQGHTLIIDGGASLHL